MAKIKLIPGYKYQSIIVHKNGSKYPQKYLKTSSFYFEGTKGKFKEF